MKSIVLLASLLFSSLTGAADPYGGKKVLYIDSYHEGYAWSDGVTLGVRQIIESSGAELKVHRMDTKRYADEAFKRQAAQTAKALIESYRPDIVIASDDNASKYLIQPFYKDVELPFVFCGLNWTEKVYGYPYSNVTGMTEVAPLDQLVDMMRPYAAGDRLALVTVDRLTERKMVDHIDEHFDLPDLRFHFAKTFEDWKRLVLEIQRQADMMVFSNHVGIEGWDDAAAKAFLDQHLLIPSGTYNTWMIDYAVFGMVKVPEEQGQWAARMALRILSGESPTSIPVTRNRRARILLNLKLAEKVDILIPEDLIELADTVVE